MTSYVGSTGPITQTVGVRYEGRTGPITQIVSLSASYSGSLGPITQQVHATYEGSTGPIRQIVREGLFPYDPYGDGWDFSVFIGGLEITKAITRSGPGFNIVISKEEDQNNTCVITVNVADPVTFIDQVYDGSQLVTIDYINSTGSHRLITALVDSPEIDFINRTVRLTCSNQRKDLITATMTTLAPSLGKYSTNIFGEPIDINDIVDKRLKTVSASLEFDSYNNVQITDWAAKTTADFVLTETDMYYRQSPSFRWQNRGDIVNTESIVLSYKRTRLYHYQRPFDWTASYYGNPTDYATNLYTAPTLDMVNSAIGQTTWKLITSVTAIPLYPLRYTWFGQPYASTVTPQISSDGVAVRDASGNILFNSLPDAETPTVYIMKTDWTQAIHFSQFIVETYNLTVTAPQSVNKYGQVVAHNSYQYEDAYDDSDWSSYVKQTPVPAGAVISGSNYYVDIAEATPGELSNAIRTALDIARASILNTHRNTTVTVLTKFIMPDVELKHTVEIAMEKLACKGKLKKIVHTLDALHGDHTTELTIALFRATGSASEDARNAPSRPSYSPAFETGTVTLGNHYGQVPVTGTSSDLWNGFIGNKATHFNSGFFNTPFTVRGAFTDTFIVDTPAIPDSLRAIVNLPVSQSYDIIIPIDPLTIDAT